MRGNTRKQILAFAEKAHVRGHVPSFKPVRIEVPRLATFTDVDPEALRKELSLQAVRGWRV